MVAMFGDVQQVLFNLATEPLGRESISMDFVHREWDIFFNILKTYKGGGGEGEINDSCESLITGA